MKRFLALACFALLIAFPHVIAGGVGASCDYMLNGDSQCDPVQGIYCSGWLCQAVSDTNTYCNDADGNNLTSAGQLGARYRDYSGMWLASSVGDDCISGNLFVPSCSATNCYVREAVCTTGGNYTFGKYPCNSCQNGACISGEYQAPQQQTSIIGKPCSYDVNGDAQCDSQDGIYCVDYSCTSVSDTNTYCNDPDANNLGSNGSLTARYREYSGRWLDANVHDDCVDNGVFVSNCSGQNCRVREATCSDASVAPNYGFDLYGCEQCQNGACISLPVPNAQQDTNVLGKACLYASLQDTECRPDQNIFCISSKCTRLDQNVSPYCLDTDDRNQFVAGDLNFLYRDYDTGAIVKGAETDACVDSNTLREFYCLEPRQGANYYLETVRCENGCLAGKCPVPAPRQTRLIDGNCHNGVRDYDETGLDCGGAYCVACRDGKPASVSDNGLLVYISGWAGGSISNQSILEILEAWKNN